MDNKGHIATIGPAEIFLLKQDWFALDGGVLFGNVPKSVWASLPGLSWIKKHNLVPLPINVFLLRTAEHAIVVDTSIGDVARWSARTRRQFRMREPVSMEDALARHGLAREDITRVLHTHAHFDHAGGDVMYDGRGALVPTFPNARYVLSRREFEHALARHPKTVSSYRRETIEGLEVLNTQGLLHLFDGGTLCLNMSAGLSIVLMATPGHTDSHYSVLVEHREAGRSAQTAFIAGALLATRWHVHPAFSIGNDASPLRGADEKMTALTRGYEENWLLLLEHETMVAARLRRGAEGAMELRGVS